MIEREYHTYLKLERGLSSHSIDAYERDLHRLKMYMDEHGIDIVHATFDDLQAFVFDVFKEIDSAKTQARLLSGIHSFYRFLLYHHYIEHQECAEPP